MSLSAALHDALQYAKAEGIEVPLPLQLRLYRVGALKGGEDLPTINADYHDAITSSLTQYFEGGSVSSPKNKFKQATVEAFGAAFDLGWVDGGGALPVDGEALSWFNARVEAEFGHIDMLFGQAKELRKETDFDFFSWITERADAYTRTVSAIYNAGVMFAKKNQMLTWRLGNTEKHCSTCQKLDGGSHRASWYIARNYIPRQPGAAMLCGGYYCDCHLETKDGNEVTI